MPFTLSPLGSDIDLQIGSPLASQSTPLLPASFQIEIDIGVPSILKSTALPYTVFINGVDRTGYVATGSLRRNMQQNSRASLSFTLLDRTWAYRPEVFQEVIVYTAAGKRYYAGYIETLEETHRNRADCMQLSVRASDYGVIADRMIIGAALGLEYGTVDASVDYVVDEYLSRHGISFAGYYGAASIIGAMTFNYITVSEALRQITAKAGLDWWIDFFKVLRVFDYTTGIEAAPISFTQTSENWVDANVVRTRSAYANRVIVKNSIWIPAIWSDAWTGTSSPRPGNELNGDTRFFVTIHPLNYTPRVLVNNVEEVVVKSTETSTNPGYDWYYIEGGFGVIQNINNTRLTASDTLVVEYPSPLPRVAIAEGTSPILERGPYEVVIEGKDLSWEGMQALADAELARRSVEAVELTIVTDSHNEPDSDSLMVGQVVDVTLTKPAVTESMLITSIESSEAPNNEFFRHTLKLTNSYPARGRATGFFGSLIERDRQPQDRILERVVFTLAQTIRGITNPGLSIGVSEALRVSQKSGYLAELSLRWKSVDDGTDTITDIEIDIYLNGVSIFSVTSPPTYLIFPAGASGTVRAWQFHTDPFPVAKGDVWTCEVITADSLAKEGSLELVIRG